MTEGEQRPGNVVPELRQLMREYEAALLSTTDTEEKRRIRNVIRQLRVSIIELENH